MMTEEQEKAAFRERVGGLVDAVSAHLKTVVTGGNSAPTREALIDLIMAIDN